MTADSVFDADVDKTSEDKERARRQQLRRLKKKFGLSVSQLILIIFTSQFHHDYCYYDDDDDYYYYYYYYYYIRLTAFFPGQPG